MYMIYRKEVFHCKSILSDQFIVYSAKKFPGMEESTFLSRSFADQGLKIRIRKELRQRRKAGKRSESDDESPRIQTRTIDKRPRQELHHHPLQADSIVPTSISTAPDHSTSTTTPSLSASSSVLDLRVPPPSSPQAMYSMQQSYGERAPTYFDPNDVDLHWAGSRAHRQQQHPQQQRPWRSNHTDVSPLNQYYINTPVTTSVTTPVPTTVTDQNRRYSPEIYADSVHQTNTTRQYHTPLPPPSLPTSYSTHSPSPYSQQAPSLHHQHQHQQQSQDTSQTHPSYNFHPQSTRPPDPYQQHHQYTDEAIHQLRIKQNNDAFSKRT
ncbi:unnamed protein product [Absidia cylindrospora]